MIQDSCQPDRRRSCVWIGSPLLEAVLFPFIEEVCLGTAQVDDLRATIPIFFLDGTLLAVVGVRHSWTPADHTAPLVRTVVTLITNAHKSAGPNVGVTDHAFAITFFTQSADCHARLLAAEDEVRVVLGHGDEIGRAHV